MPPASSAAPSAGRGAPGPGGTQASSPAWSAKDGCTPAGVAEVERAKADVRWDAAHTGQASMEVPADLAATPPAHPRAQAMFDILTSRNRYAVLYRIASAKRRQPGPAGVESFVAMLARGETVYPQKRTLAD
jgi:uncharacterized protein YdeI (YjbR/CyaY-like superfamily)